MGSCYSSNHVAGDHVHTGIITCNIEEPRPMYRLGTISSRLLGGGLKLVLLDSNPRPLLLQWFKTYGPHEGLLTHQ